MSPKKTMYDPTTATYLDPNVDRRVVLVTGANSGIGYYTVLHLYLHGYIVYVAGRNESKITKALEDIKSEAETRRKGYSDDVAGQRHLGQLKVIIMDLMDLGSVIAGAETFGKQESKLHILINNAGIMGVPYEVTKDGYEIQYQVNFVSHFLLTFKLLPYLQNALEDKQQPRVIHLSSLGHNLAYKHFAPSDKIEKFPNALFSWVRYGQAKLAAIQFMRRFAKEYPDILAVSVHPGVIVDTELYNYWKRLAVVGPFIKTSLRAAHKVMGVTLEEGSYATLRCALDPELSVRKDNGKYFVTGGVEAQPSKLASNNTYIDETWDWNIKELENHGFMVDTHPVL